MLLSALRDSARADWKMEARKWFWDSALAWGMCTGNGDSVCGLCGRISYANITPLIAYPDDWCVFCQSTVESTLDSYLCGWPNEGIDLPEHTWELTLRRSCSEASRLITKSRMGRREDATHKTGPRWTYGLTQSKARRRVGVWE